MNTAEGTAGRSLPFEIVRRGKVYEEVVQQIREQIVAGRLKVGDMLPSERELAARFQVSRSSIRDAIRALQFMGLVRSRQGRGTVVCEPSPESLVEPLSRALADQRSTVSELLDLRKMLEPGLAARAALQVTEEDLARLELVLRRQEEKVERGEPAAEEDAEFHYLISLAARNAAVLRVLDLLMDLLQNTRARALQASGRPRRSLQGHRRILSALRKRDPRAAQAAMLHHLGEIEALVGEPEVP
ncbi:MAG TPA: FadR/GntR family transcriptional regulator [Myxococcales bacterium]|nr:FadR/GntR family transcriptional regulator [Myxococcales bacterium]